MPALPTITVSQTHYDRLVTAMPGSNSEQKTTNYQNLVLNGLIGYIEQVEMEAMEAAQMTARQAETARIQASLPARLPFPV